MKNDAVSPGEVFVRDAHGRNERQLTHFNDAFIAEVDNREPEPFVVNSADGTPIHGWVIKPSGFQEQTRYPLLLEIHGGPFGMYGESLFHEFQVLAARGYVVLYPIRVARPATATILRASSFAPGASTTSQT